jgi:hypothetical protein
MRQVLLALAGVHRDHFIWKAGFLECGTILRGLRGRR